MARFSVAGRSTVVGTTARAIATLFSSASHGFTLREVGIFNTTATATAAALARITNTTGQGAGLTEGEWDGARPVNNITGFAGHTADAGIGDILRQAAIGAAIGAGVIWTFGDSGIYVPVGTSNGIGVIGVSGVTGQILDYYYDWEE